VKGYFKTKIDILCSWFRDVRSPNLMTFNNKTITEQMPEINMQSCMIHFFTSPRITMSKNISGNDSLYRVHKKDAEK